MSLIQSGTAESLGATASISVTLNGVVTGNDLRLHVTWGTDTLTDFDTVTDGVNNAKWTIDKKVASGGHSQSDGMAYAVGVTGGSLTVSCNFLNTPTFKGLLLEEFSASTGFRASAMQLQANPGSGVDAITSGATTAVSGDEIVGGTSDVSPGTDTFTIGTGYSDGATIADSGNIEMHSEWKSGSGSDAGTFKGAAGTGNYITGAMAFKPASSGDVLMAQVCM